MSFKEFAIFLLMTAGYHVSVLTGAIFDFYPVPERGDLLTQSVVLASLCTLLGRLNRLRSE